MIDYWGGRKTKLLTPWAGKKAEGGVLFIHFEDVIISGLDYSGNL